eukprot:scaffold321445_cov12-Tisochrysis_lutea.AAC.1
MPDRYAMRQWAWRWMPDRYAMRQWAGGVWLVPNLGRAHMPPRSREVGTGKSIGALGRSQKGQWLQGRGTSLGRSQKSRGIA